MPTTGDTREKIEFTSEGAILRGFYYTPDAPVPHPAIVMTHGTSATLPMTVDRYAEVFRRAGFAVLLYEHRNLGISGGEPRQEINPWIQARGYRDAITYILSRRDVAADRIGVWGYSLSGMLAFMVATLDTRVAAVVVQCPNCGMEPPSEEPEAFLEHLRATFDHGDISGTPETTVGPIPVVSTDQMGTPSLLKPMSAFRWFLEYGGRHGSGWQNVVTRVTPATPVPFSPYLAAPHLKADLLMLVASEDEMVNCNPNVSLATYDRVPGYKEKGSVAGGHYGLMHYPSEVFDHVTAVERDFFVRRLLKSPKAR